MPRTARTANPIMMLATMTILPCVCANRSTRTTLERVPHRGEIPRGFFYFMPQLKADTPASIEAGVELCRVARDRGLPNAYNRCEFERGKQCNERDRKNDEKHSRTR